MIQFSVRLCRPTSAMRAPVGIKALTRSFATPKAAPKLENEEFEPGFTVDMTTLRTMKIAATPVDVRYPVDRGECYCGSLSLGVGFRAAPALLARMAATTGAATDATIERRMREKSRRPLLTPAAQAASHGRSAEDATEGEVEERELRGGRAECFPGPPAP